MAVCADQIVQGFQSKTAAKVASASLTSRLRDSAQPAGGAPKSAFGSERVKESIRESMVNLCAFAHKLTKNRTSRRLTITPDNLALSLILLFI